MLFCEKMAGNEAIIINGTKKFANLSGYAWKMKLESKPIETEELHDFIVFDASEFKMRNL